MTDPMLSLLRLSGFNLLNFAGEALRSYPDLWPRYGECCRSFPPSPINRKMAWVWWASMLKITSMLTITSSIVIVAKGRNLALGCIN